MLKQTTKDGAIDDDDDDDDEKDDDVDDDGTTCWNTIERPNEWKQRQQIHTTL